MSLAITVSSQTIDPIHEPLDTVTIYRVPSHAINLEVRANDTTVRK
jgi:hypothetical protein